MRRLKWIAAAALVLCLAGALFEQVGRYRDRHRFAQIGTSVNIGGRTLNISCLGSGSPTVIFDTYGHQSGYAWSAVQTEVARYTRTCWYDRAGYGWSELGPPQRTFQAVAADLHALLQQAGIPFPVVLVGAGDAASHIRVYHGSYPAEVAGIVLLDANDVDDPKLGIPDAEEGGFQRLFGTWAAGARRTACAMRPLLGGVGAIRFAALFQKPRRTISFGLSAAQQAELDELSDNATTQQSTEACAREESMREVRSAGGLGEVPLLVLASRAGRMTVPQALAGLSTRGRVVPLAGELTLDALARTIRGVLDAAAAAHLPTTPGKRTAAAAHVSRDGARGAAAGNSEPDVAAHL